MKTLVNKQLLESSSIFLDLSKSLLNKIDNFITIANLDKKQQTELMGIFREIYSQAYEDGMTD